MAHVLDTPHVFIEDSRGWCRCGRMEESTLHRRLTDVMEFDCPIQVHEGGTVTAAPAGIHAPNLMDDELDDGRWEFFSIGYTGQHGYNGPVMHNSEYIGGRLETDILTEPGVYVAVVAYWSPDGEAPEGEPDTIEGWAVVKLREE